MLKLQKLAAQRCRSAGVEIQQRFGFVPLGPRLVVRLAVLSRHETYHGLCPSGSELQLLHFPRFHKRRAYFDANTLTIRNVRPPGADKAPAMGSIRGVT